MNGHLVGPGAVLPGADLSGAALDGMDLSNAVLTNANLAGANLNGTDLSGSDMLGANVAGANLGGANLRFVVDLSLVVGAALYDLDTDFTGTGFDPVAAGWTLLGPPAPVPSLGSLGLALLAAAAIVAALRRVPAQATS